MRIRWRCGVKLYGLVLLTGVLSLAAAVAQAQETSPAAQPGAVPLIKTETRLVLVDAVVTDKKGQYVADLEGKNFKVWEDNKEQTVKTFSFSADPVSPASSQKRYLVLFFDNSTMDFGEQVQARKAAAKFIDSNTGPNRLLAIVNYGGTLQIAQNFTADAERLKQVVSGIKTAFVSPNGDAGGPSLGGSARGFGARSVVLALRELAKNLSEVPGRKSLIMLTSGFRLTDEVRSELTAAIDMCNRANVAIYPIDVRGLTTMPFAGGPRGDLRLPSGIGLRGPRFSSPVMLASFVAAASASPAEYEEQASGGTRGTPTGTANPGSNPGKSPTNSGGNSNLNNNNSMMNRNSPFNTSRTIVPPFPPSALDNQQALYMLAEGTGGFVIVNTNDLLGGLEKIGKEQNQYYILGYTPTESAEGSCHTLKVKVDHGMNVRARTGYCNVKSTDPLAGKPSEKQLETRVNGSAPGTIAASMQAPFFYASPDTARVDVAIDMPADAIKFEKVKGKYHAAMDVLGIAYRPDGNVAARFSDTVKLDLEDKKQVEQFAEKPFHYENQFDVGSGQYTLKVAFSSGGEGFGKLEAPLAIDANDGKKFTLSSLALSREIHKISELETNLDAELLEGRAPLVAGIYRFTPTGTYRFKTTETPTVYFEVYEPLLSEAQQPAQQPASQAAQPAPQVGVQLLITDRKTGKQEADSGVVNIANYIKAGNPVIAAGLKLPVSALKPGSYTVGIKAMDSAGGAVLRSADFEVQ